jgi:hypothetical protein
MKGLLMSISSTLETTFTCKYCGTDLVLEEKKVKPKKIFGNEISDAKIRLIKKAMHVGWLFDTKDCSCPTCRAKQKGN